MSRLLLLLIVGLFVQALAKSEDVKFVFADDDLIPDNYKGAGQGYTTTLAAIDQVTTKWFNLADEVAGTPSSEVPSKFTAKVQEVVSRDIKVAVSGSVLGEHTYTGVNGAVEYLQNIASRLAKSQGLLTNKVYTWKDENEVDIEAKYHGWEQTTAGIYSTFWGFRYYTVKKVDGSWKLARVTRKRLETFLVNEDVSKIDDVTTRWFNLADEVAGLSASKVDADFASKVAATTTPDVQVTATRSVVDNAYPAGRSGAIQYLKDIASRVTSSLALLSNKVYTYTDPNTVEVEARYTGFEQLRTGETREYYGIRHYTVKRADGETWLVSKVRRERHITVVDNSEIEEIDQVSTEWFNLADEVAGKDPKDVVAEFADEVEKTTTSDVVVIVKNSLIPDETFRGRKGALNYLASVAKSVDKSGAVLANREFKWESPSRVVVSGRYTGYEHVKGGDYHTYWGTRTYTVDKQTDGSWKISQVTRIREVTLQATVVKK